MINKKRLIKLTQNLIKINSENPGSDEYKIARFIKQYLNRIGVTAKIYEFKRRRSNIVALLKNKDSRHSLLLTPHLDTVPAGSNWRFPPFAAIINHQRIYGRGASDCKGNLAIALEAINSLVEDRKILNYNLIFAATADEETGSSLGLLPLINKKIIDPDSALILDAHEFNIVVTQKGLIHLKVKVQGKKAHGAYPWQGENAIDLSIDIIKEIERHRFNYQRNSLLREPTVNVGTIHGGDKVNVVSDWCEFELDIRFLPGMSCAAILKTVKNIIRSYTHRFKIEIEGIQKPYEIDKRHALVRYLLKAAKNFKIKAKVAGSDGATTITFFQQRHIPAVAFGIASRGCAHITDEYLSIDNLYNGARVLEKFLKIYQF
jgi:acetylornithine deacetylase/succinyl-diaminopimelate desuccinylase family protein